MKAKDLQNLSEEQLKAELYKLREELANLSVKTKSSQQKNVHKAGGIKKDIARILTTLTKLRIQTEKSV